ncbi:MAG: Ribosome small subunit biogenesis RbfA-release protein RsgA [uncultured Thermomicrobiales bacterium]|uniref:Small ribosomal subunit biogenesis GTPase RsgA n=1 Tax=uncultured Thermomicrobiales bacterium TaxID=1645740 RepID=A0A6J4VMH6_9BACT|nr:MAG: Ribosome small subunit biogenesis RbfA-release protein RsgA [uncultured Thermomicrobiales bacterium]
MPPVDACHGIVTRAHGLWYEVSLYGSGETLIASMRGSLKRNRRRTDIVAVGDRVWVTRLPDDEGAIEAVDPRDRALVRTARNTRDTEQVVLANPDQVGFVFAVKEPEPHVRMLDRFIVLAELQEIPIRIIVTKLDLEDADTLARDRFGVYERVYPVHYVSIRSGLGIDELKTAIEGRITVMAGPSGVGKSSLLNALDPQHLRDVSHVSGATGKGRHTTIGSQIHRLGDDTFVADTPGIRSLAMHAVPGERLPWAFREFRRFLAGCFYQDCTHVHEPDCAVRDAVQRGDISAPRYESYVALRRGDRGAGDPDA